MSFLTGLGAFAGGAAQGLDRGHLIAQRALQIRQGQAELEQAARQLKADAAAFAGLDQPGAGFGGPMSFAPGLPGPQGGAAPPQSYTQPMAPGQASVPAQQPAVPQQPGFSKAPPSAGGSPPSPSPVQPGGGGLSPAGQPGEIDPTDPRAAVMTVMQIAREIKSRNPDIDPQTLMMATSRIIDMSKGMAPALRQGAQVVVQQLRNEGAMERTGAQIASRENIAGQQIESRENIAGQNIASREGIAGQRDATTRRGQDLGLLRARETADAATERTRMAQEGANQRAASGAWTRTKLAAYNERIRAATAKMNVAQRQLSSLQQSLVRAEDPRAIKAAQEVEAAAAELDRVNQAAGLAEGPAPAMGAPAAAPAPGSRQAPAARAARGPAPASLRGKPIWPEGNKWVFEDGTEAK